MRQWVDGKYVDMTAGEIAELETPPEDAAAAQPTAEQRLQALEMAMLDLIMGG